MQSKNKFELNINFEGTTIETSDLAKFLRIHVDCYLKWPRYPVVLQKKQILACFQMRILGETVDFKTKRMIYYALFALIMQLWSWSLRGTTKTVSIFQLQKIYY